jgi:arginase
VRRIAILDAPSNLGLRPPTETSVPGCAKAPGALRDHGLITRLHARDAGCLTPPRYDPGDWRPGDGVCHATEIAGYSRKLADRVGAIIDAGEFPVVLGGDCSILLGSGLAMHRLGEAVGGRIGLVFVDGHSDFRHPGNAPYVGAAAGEDLALVTGRGQADLAAMEGRRPYFRDVDVVVLGIRAQDEYRLDLQAAGILTRPVPTLRVEGAARSAQWARDQLVDCAGYWVHVDVDVLDPAVMPAVDAPDQGGIAFPELELLLAGLVDTPHCLGVEITVFDPDYDPDGRYAEEITSAIVAGLAPVRTVAARPDLIAARRDLAAARTDEPDPVRERRAAASAESVLLAAVGMSGGGAAPPGLPVEAAVPATTLLGVEEAAEVFSDAEAPTGDSRDNSDIDRPSTEGDAGVGERPSGEDNSGNGAQADRDAAVQAGDTADHADDGPGDPGVPAEAVAADFDDAGPTEPVDYWTDAGSGGGPDDDPDHDETTIGESEPDDTVEAEYAESGASIPAQAAGRPLGSAPLLDSEPLPATRPGMLRPRTVEGFSLPVQRPAFDVGPGEPADIA